MKRTQIRKKRISILLTAVMMLTCLWPGNIAAAQTLKEGDSLQQSYYLTVYSTETPFYEKADNLDQETKSIYMAASRDGENFEVLNNGGGVIFSKNIKGTLAVTDPRIYKEHGQFIVTASDADPQKGVHLFTSEDGVHYYDDELIPSDSRSAAALDRANCRLMLDGKNILDTDPSITLGNALELTEQEYSFILNQLGTIVNTGLENLNDLDISVGEDAAERLRENYAAANATYSDGSTQAFPIDWSGALENIDLSKPGSYTLTGRVIQPKYLNKLKELNGSVLPEDDPDNRNPQEKDHYDEATKTVYFDETKFVEGMADPCIYWDEKTGYYYMTGSYFPEEGDAIDDTDKTQQYDRVVLRRARTLEGLQNRKNQVTIWKAGNQGFQDNGSEEKRGFRNIWAPEIHRVGSNWVIYFTESHSSNAFNIFCHALVLDGSRDPYETALTSGSEPSQWSDYKMYAADSVKTDPFNLSFCLDMTYFKDEVSGISYVIWAGKPSAAYMGGSTDLFIARISEETPWMITSEAVRLSKSDYGWERVRYCVNEGPTVLQKDGNIFMCYSASGTGSEYAIGMCRAKGGGDLLDAANWTKSPYPLLTSRDAAGEEGPGHNSFTVDQYGNVIFVYHARPTSHNSKMCGWDGKKSTYNSEPLNDPCRHARLKRVHWAADGTPILKMTYENELPEKYRTIPIRINVTAPTPTPSTVTPTGDIPSGQPSPLPEVTPVSVVTKTEQLILNKKKLIMGEKERFTLSVKRIPATEEPVMWYSGKPSVATVKNGRVTARRKGTAVITAEVSGIRAKCRITVRKAPGRITLHTKKKTLKKGKTFRIKIKLPKNTASHTITYTSNNKKVAAVNKTGTIKALRSGTASITVKTYNEKRAVLRLTVR